LDKQVARMAGKNLLAALLLVCGILTAGMGYYIIGTSRSVDERWPGAGPLIVDRTGTLDAAIAHRAWSNADEFWRSTRVALSFTIADSESGDADLDANGLNLADETNEPPLRMSVSLKMGEVRTVSFAASPLLKGLVGAGCLEDGVRPLAERLATVGGWDNAARLVVDYVSVAMTTLPLGNRLTRGQALWLPIGCTLAFIALGIFWRDDQKRRSPLATTSSPRQIQGDAPQTDMAPSRLRAALQAATIDEMAAAQRAKAINSRILEQHRIARNPTWKQRIPLIGWALRMGRCRHLAKLEIRLRDQQAALAVATARRRTAELAVERDHAAIERRKALKVKGEQRRSRLIALFRRIMAIAITVVAVVVAGLSGRDAIGADDGAGGGRILFQRAIRIPPTSLLYAALDINRDLIEPFHNQCNMIMAVAGVSSTPRSPAIYSVLPPEPAITGDAMGPHCITGKRCGDACIPQHRLCRVEDSGHSAGSSHGPDGTYIVEGYVRKDGTYVSPHLTHNPSRRR
jgi:hypothetical protein